MTLVRPGLPSLKMITPDAPAVWHSEPSPKSIAALDQRDPAGHEAVGRQRHPLDELGVSRRMMSRRPAGAASLVGPVLAWDSTHW
jgi:hypothetical protein